MPETNLVFDESLADDVDDTVNEDASAYDEIAEADEAAHSAALHHDPRHKLVESD